MRVLILLALLGSALAVPRSVTRIVGGSPTTVDQYPYMANMKFGILGAWYIHQCGGSLLSPTVVLSAAHCYEGGDPPHWWRAVLGTSFASSGGATRAVSRVTPHPAYDGPMFNNDVAILHLAVAAVYSPNVRGARIPASDYVVPDGAVVTAIGWGSLTSGGSYTQQLQHVDVNIINQELCAERYAYLKSQPGFSGWPDVTDGMLCAGILDVGGKGACLADDGGPLAYERDIVVGITSWGYQCAHQRYPGVSARVSTYTDWIIANA